jgi:endonuclease III
MSSVSVTDVDNIIKDFECENTLGVARKLLAVATALYTHHEGLVPQTKEGLKSIGVEEPVTSLLMQQVYGSSELVVSLHARKILVALDMVDWEEAGTNNKSDVKMVKLTPEKVAKSLRTWLPKGESVNFHSIMDSIGNLLSARSIGQWGMITDAISRHFSTKDKEALVSMTNTISQFFKATKQKKKRT